MTSGVSADTMFIFFIFEALYSIVAPTIRKIAMKTRINGRIGRKNENPKSRFNPRYISTQTRMLNGIPYRSDFSP